MIATIDIRRLIISATGAALLSTACVAAAIGPARAQANAPLTLDDWRRDVERRIDATLRIPRGALARQDQAAAFVRLSFDAEGDFAGARISESSGNAIIDGEAIRVANALRYPALPAGLRGRPQTVGMIIHMGQSITPDQAARAIDRMERLASGKRKKDHGVETAALPEG